MAHPTTNRVAVFHTQDGGTQWTTSDLAPAVKYGNLGFSIYLSAVSAKSAWIWATSFVGSNQATAALWHTRPDHPQWTRVWHGITRGLNGFQFLNGQDGVETGTSLVKSQVSMAYTTRSGAAWSPIHLGLSVGSFYPVTLPPARVAGQPRAAITAVLLEPTASTAAAVGIQFYRTISGGHTWTPLASNPVSKIAVAPSHIIQSWPSADNGWIVLGSMLYTTENAGVTWHPTSLPVGTPLSLQRLSASVGYLIESHDAQTHMLFWLILFVIGLTHYVVIATFSLSKMVGTRCRPTLIIRVWRRPCVLAVRPT